ncbi:XRE family transcriptional regulator [Sinorhizobium medicae]|nr:XRE family transcriptional regulator [Sinorhizobium medicae]MDX1084992.1 XRE family transcriptional regulator [Sinorhizobium medicae]
MRIPAPADALRVARALLDLSQRAAAARADVFQKSLSKLESTDNILADTNLVLVDFYTAEGIEFLGDASIGTEVVRTGAKWTAPIDPEASPSVKLKFHAEDSAISFRAARALINASRVEIAKRTNLSISAIKGLENGEEWAESHQKLLRYYQESGVEFTGWGDPVTGKYYGVGVRWKAALLTDPANATA